jgi:predicted TIM-barrel fold metal-dependent hydrolase
MARPLPVSLPFDPNPRPPRWRLPAGSCDTHFHIFGPPDRFPYDPGRRYEPPAAPYEHYRAMQAVVGLERGVVVQPTAHGVDPAPLLDALARSAGSLRGVCALDVTVSDSKLAEMQAAGVVGARFSLMSDRAGDRAAIEAAVPRMTALGWSLDLHIEPKHLLANEAFVRNLPLTVVIDHMARPDVSEGLDQPAFRLLLHLLKDKRFWTKLCAADKLTKLAPGELLGGISFGDVLPYARAVIDVAPDRVIWGSDWPHGNTFEMGCVPNDGLLLDWLGAAALDEDTRRRILVDNPARLYGF